MADGRRGRGAEQEAGGDRETGNEAAKPPLVIKKYANRRLYHTGTSAYVTLDDLAGLVKRGEDFVVTDARTGEDITRSVLAQIIFEQEGRGASLLPVAFLRQLIGLYGDSVGAFVPGYLELSLQSFGREQEKLRERVGEVFGARSLGGAFGSEAYAAMEEQARRNMAAFTEAMRAFTPFAPLAVPGPAPAAPAEAGERRDEEIETLKREMETMRARVDRLTKP